MAAVGEGRPRLSLCLIARNEANNLGRCLASVAGLVDEILVVDTGSTDDTPAIAHRFGGRVEHFPWCGDFAAARNYGLDRVRGQWVLALDADDELAPADRDLLPPLLGPSRWEGFCFRTVNFVGRAPGARTVSVAQLRLWRNRPEYRYSGAVHEVLLPLLQPGVPVCYRPLRVYHYGYLTPAVAAGGKIERNLELLQRLVAARPDDPLRLYQLANEYTRQGDWARAAAEYGGALARVRRAGQRAPDLVRRYCLALLYAGAPDRALAEVEHGLVAFPDYTDLHFIHGRLLRAGGEYGAALAAFRRCLLLGPPPPGYPHEDGTGTWQALQAVGEIHYELGNYREALGWFRRALAACPDWPLPLWYILLCWRCLADTRAARRDLAAHFDWDDESRRVLAALCARLEEAGAAPAPDPADPLLRAEAALFDQRFGQAMGACQDLIASDPRCLPAWVCWAQALLAAGAGWLRDTPGAATAWLRRLPVWAWRRGERLGPAPATALDPVLDRS